MKIGLFFELLLVFLKNVRKIRTTSCQKNRFVRQSDARWCERSAGQLMASLLSDYLWVSYDIGWVSYAGCIVMQMCICYSKRKESFLKNLPVDKKQINFRK